MLRDGGDASRRVSGESNPAGDRMICMICMIALNPCSPHETAWRWRAQEQTIMVIVPSCWIPGRGALSTTGRADCGQGALA